MASQAGRACRRHLIFRQDGPRIGIEHEFEQLPGAVELRGDESRHPFRYVAFRTCDLGVGRYVVSDPLWIHDVTALATKGRLVHVSNSAIARGAQNDKVNERGEYNKDQSSTNNWATQLNLGIGSGQLTSGLELSLPQ